MSDYAQILMADFDARCGMHTVALVFVAVGRSGGSGIDSLGRHHLRVFLSCHSDFGQHSNMVSAAQWSPAGGALHDLGDTLSAAVRRVVLSVFALPARRRKIYLSLMEFIAGVAVENSVFSVKFRKTPFFP